MKNKYLKYIYELIFFITLIAVDLISKTAVFNLLQDKGGSYVVLDKIFTLTLAKNTGASFSILSGQIAFLTIMPTIVSIAIITLLIIRPNTPKIFRLGTIMICAGAIGNVIDRFTLGYVRDFIDYTFLYTFFKIDFAIGNIADLFLIVGVILLCGYIIFDFNEKDFMSKKKLEKLQNLEDMNEVQNGK